jgi:hypothetical protein
MCIRDNRFFSSELRVFIWNDNLRGKVKQEISFVYKMYIIAYPWRITDYQTFFTFSKFKFT